MRKLDWVERKVGNSTIFIDAATVKKWLRAERARAVRVCRKQKNDNVFYNCTSVSNYARKTNL